MAASASAILDQCVTTLESMSLVGSGNVSRRGYDILEKTNSQCCFRVRPVRAGNRFSHFASTGDTLHQDITLRAEGFVKLQDNQETWYDAQDNLIHDMMTTFDDAQTLNDTVAWAIVESWEFTDFELNIAGVVWQPIRFQIKVKNV